MPISLSELLLWGAVLGAAPFLWWLVRRHRVASDRGEISSTLGVQTPESGDSGNDADLQNSMGSLPDAVMLIGDQGKLMWANDTAREWFDIDFNAHLDRPVWQVITIPGFAEYLSRREYAESFECAAPGDGNVQLDIRIVPYRAGQFLLQGRDITKIRQLEQIRKDFVANASHELRTPLSILYGYLEMMQDETDDNISRQWKPAVNQMFEQTGRIKQIIDDMMLLSRLEDVDEALDQHFTPFAPMLHTACKDAEALAALKNQVVKKDVDENYSLLCNDKEIHSLVMNLVSNAIRYTPDGGSITVNWKVDLIGGYLSVIDTGIGIEQENIPRLTERFYRTDPARSRAAGGTGLGLAIVNHIVNRHNAKLLIQSKVGQGSTFTIQFPFESVRADHDQVNLLLK